MNNGRAGPGRGDGCRGDGWWILRSIGSIVVTTPRCADTTEIEGSLELSALDTAMPCERCGAPGIVSRN